MIFETTIVSAFVTGINKKKDMDISHYLECGKKLLRLPIPKIIFIEYSIYLSFLETKEKEEEYPLTEFIFIDPKKDIYLYTFLPHITNFQINSVNPDKDTIDYLFVQCNKTEWVRQAIYRNTFKTKQFTWIDFGIYHIVKNEALFKNAIMKISQTSVEKLAVGSCWNLRLPFVRDIYKDVAWFFAGGIFGGEPQYLLEFADLVQQKCIQYITERRSFIWETNIWYLVYKDSLLNRTFSTSFNRTNDYLENLQLFSPYLAEHDVSLLQNYGNTTDHLVIVSAVFAEVIKKKTMEQLYEHLYFLADIRCPLILFIDNSFPSEIRDFILKTYPNVYLSNLGEITFPWNSPIFLEIAGIQLPSSRNSEKDTLEHMWNMHSKVYCLEKALDIYPHNPFSFLWIDYDISEICSKQWKPVQTFLYELSVREHIPFPLTDQMIIPGCWSKISTDIFDNVEKQESFLNNVSWRFCGNVLWGNPLAIRKFRYLYDKYFRNFLRTNNILTWEVNFWAYLESILSDKDKDKDKWNPIWYSADHNDSLFHIPSEYICNKLGEDIENEYKITYPLIFGKHYKPTSASYFYLPSSSSDEKEGKHYLNTRFINYHITENGYYLWPEGEGKTIRNKNIFSELSPDSLDIISYREMRETDIPNYKMGGISEGIEDIRLFYSNNSDSIRFIGSTFNHSSNEKIQMITGKYDFLLGELIDTFVIESPYDTWCEKNWIPIFPWNKDSSEEPYFIYKWYPMEIGRIISSENNTKKLEIQIRHETSHFIFRNIRGSTCFLREIIEGTEGFVGVVHYSEDRSPTRHYFHRLILLDKTDFKPLKYTDAFYFYNLSVEFCIGFTKKDNTYIFWISQMDREPMRIILEKDKVLKWNTCGKWGG